MKITVSVEIDTDHLSRVSDSHLAALWHIAQINPAEHGDKEAGEIAEHIGREIIQRWLRKTQPELWRHQGRDHYWTALTRLARWDGTEWVPRDAEQAEEGDTQ